jgi:acetyltransferase-like isoleucine patch superfamily enzyme
VGALRADRARVDHDLWIGDRAIRLPGVAVGAGAMIGAGAVVATVPPGAPSS